MLPYRFQSLIVGADCLLTGPVAAITGLLGLVGVADAELWRALVGIGVGAGITALGVASVRDYLEQEVRVQARRERRRRRR